MIIYITFLIIFSIMLTWSTIRRYHVNDYYETLKSCTWLSLKAEREQASVNKQLRRVQIMASIGMIANIILMLITIYYS